MDDDTEMYPKEKKSLSFEELLDVVACAFSKLNFNYPIEQATLVCFKLNGCYLPSGPVLSLHRNLLFFPDLHAEISKSWKNLCSSCVYTVASLNYLSLIGFIKNGYTVEETLPRVEETLATYLPFLGSVEKTSTKPQNLPSMPQSRWPAPLAVPWLR